MKNLVLLLFVGLSSHFLHAQLSLSGKILDKDSATGVDYVNIGIIDRAQGTVSDVDGSFDLKIYESLPTDTVQISRIGYATLKFSLAGFKKELEKEPVIHLLREDVALDEVVISNKDAKKNRIGYTKFTENLVGYWNDIDALGGEHASKIIVRKGAVKLEDLSFKVVKSISDSLLVRVNIYEIDNGLPGRNIAKKQILHTIKEQSGRIIIDLSPYNILVDDHFIVSLELLKIYGGKVGMTIAAYNDGYRSYTRLISQDRWRKMRKGTTIAFNLNTSSVDKKNLLAHQKKKNKKPERVTILWDNSLSMQRRDLQEELAYLDRFFDQLGNADLVFQTFGYELGEKLNFKLTNGRWEKLKTHIQGIIYDGAGISLYTPQLKPGEFTLLFTDATDFSEDVNRNWNGQIYTINSQPKARHKLLSAIAVESGGDYIDLSSRYDLERAADYKRMQGNYVAPTEEISATAEFMRIKGNVSDFDDPIENVLVRVKGSNRQVRTDHEGNFEIQSRTGEILVFSYPGRENVEAIVNSRTTMLNITMPINVRVLDEAVVTENLRMLEIEKEILSEKKAISTIYGKLDPNKSGFAVKQISGDEIFQGSGSIVDALAGKFPGVRVIRSYTAQSQEAVPSRDDPQGLGRPKRMFQYETPLIALRGLESQGVFASWDVDGHFYRPAEVPFHIDIANIRTITIMPGSWAAARYGRDAPGGIIIVRTITSFLGDPETSGAQPSNRLKSGKTTYRDEAVFPELEIRHQPGYLQEIDKAETANDAYATYLNQRKQWENDPEYYVNVYDYFGKKWPQFEKAGFILSNLLEISKNDINTLRLLAYKYDENREWEKALIIYKSLQSQASEQLQSMRDLAKAHVQSGRYRQGWLHYDRYLKMRNDSLESEGLDKIVRQEMLELVANHPDEISVDQDYFDLEEEKEDISIIVQWNNPNAEFELQFVGPTNNYYTWKHTDTDNYELLARERSTGAFSKSFAIEDIGQGPWKINTRYLGNKENTPSHLKFTIKNNQKGSETVKVLSLEKSDVNYRTMDISKNEVKSLYK